MLSASAGGWGRSAPPAPKLDPGRFLPDRRPGEQPRCAQRCPADRVLDRYRQHAPPPAGPGSRGTGPEGGGRPESADTDELTNKLMRIPAPPAPDFSSQDAQPLSPPKAQLRISGVFAPFGRQQCHSGGVLSPGARHALARDRANKRGIVLKAPEENQNRIAKLPLPAVLMRCYICVHTWRPRQGGREVGQQVFLSRFKPLIVNLCEI